MSPVKSSEYTIRCRKLRRNHSAGTAAERRIDPLLRLNLPFLLGRRDAALDAAEKLAGKLAGEKISGEQPSLWENRCETLLKLIRSAAADTEMISSLLSSPDTRVREHRLLLHISMLECVAVALESVNNLYGVMFEREEPADRKLDFETNSFLEYDEKLRNGGLQLIEWLRDGFSRARPRQLRYREYALKSFNAENAERYHKAYDSSFRMFHDSVQQVQTT